MDRIIQSPGKYIQGADVLTRLGDYLKPWPIAGWLSAINLFWVLPKRPCARVLKKPNCMPKSRRLVANVHKMKSIV